MKKDQATLVHVIERANNKIKIGSKYRHYKHSDKIYEVIGLGFYESNDQLCVIYKALYGDQITFIRPLDNWLESVEFDGKMVERFALI